MINHAKKVAFTLALFLSLMHASQAFAQKGLVFANARSDWGVQKVGQDQAAKPYCVMTTQFQEGATMSVAQNLNKEVSLGLEFGGYDLSRFGDRFNVVLDPGAGVQISREAVLNGVNAVVIRLGAEERFFRALKKTGYLRIEMAGNSFGFNLANIDAAKLRLDNCMYSIPRSVRVADDVRANEGTAKLENKLDVMQKQIEQLTQLTSQLATENQRLAEQKRVAPIPAPVPIVSAKNLSPEPPTAIKLTPPHDTKMPVHDEAQPSRKFAQPVEGNERINSAPKKTTSLSDGSKREAISQLDIAAVDKEEPIVAQRTRSENVIEAPKQDVRSTSNKVAKAEVKAPKFPVEVGQKESKGLLPLPGEKKVTSPKKMDKGSVDLYSSGGKIEVSSNSKHTEAKKERLFEGELQSEEFSPYTTARLVAEKEMAAREGQEKQKIEEPVLKDETFFDNLLKEFEALEEEIETQDGADVPKQVAPSSSVAAVQNPPGVSKRSSDSSADVDLLSLTEAQRFEEREKRLQKPAIAIKMPEKKTEKIEEAAVEEGVVKENEPAFVPQEIEREDVLVAESAEIVVLPEETVSALAPQASTPVLKAPVPTMDADEKKADIEPKQVEARTDIRPKPVNAVYVPGYSVRSVLSEANIVDPAQVRVVKQASGPQALVHQWTLDDVYGSSEQRPVSGEADFERLVQDYLEKTENRCAGDYAIVPDKSFDKLSTRIDTYEIACVGQDASSSASLLFVKKGDTFTVLAHEASVDDMAEAIALRDRASDALFQ
ncbi:MAG: hypothetical protein AAF182_02070 [Pseudomonadota bacterium]